MIARLREPAGVAQPVASVCGGSVGEGILQRTALLPFFLLGPRTQPLGGHVALLAAHVDGRILGTL